MAWPRNPRVQQGIQIYIQVANVAIFSEKAFFIRVRMVTLGYSLLYALYYEMFRPSQ